MITETPETEHTQLQDKTKLTLLTLLQLILLFLPLYSFRYQLTLAFPLSCHPHPSTLPPNLSFSPPMPLFPLCFSFHPCISQHLSPFPLSPLPSPSILSPSPVHTSPYLSIFHHQRLCFPSISLSLSIPFSLPSPISPFSLYPVTHLFTLPPTCLSIMKTSLFPLPFLYLSTPHSLLSLTSSPSSHPPSSFLYQYL